MFRQQLGARLATLAFLALCANTALAGGSVGVVQRYGFDPLQKYDVYAAQKYAAQKYAAQRIVSAYPAPVAACPKCCHPKIIYRHHACCKRRSCCCCQSPFQVVLPVKDPRCCGCTIPVPIPVPPCCKDVPLGKVRCGLFVRGVATFKWCCGYMVKVVLRHNGEIVVHTFGGPIRPHAHAYVTAPAHEVYMPVPTPATPQPYSGPELAPAMPSENTGPELVPQPGYAF